MWEGTFQTDTPMEAVWEEYTDASCWHIWTKDIKWATLEGPLRDGAEGRVKYTGVPASPYRLSGVDRPHSFVIRLRILGGMVKVSFDHALIARHPEGTTIHERIGFGGPLGWLFGLLQRRRIERNWPKAMAQMAERAAERGSP